MAGASAAAATAAAAAAAGAAPASTAAGAALLLPLLRCASSAAGAAMGQQRCEDPIQRPPASPAPSPCRKLAHLRACAALLPAGRDGPRAYDYLDKALSLAEAALKQPGASSDGGPAPAPLPPLAPPSPETAVEGDVPPALTPAEVRFSALTWIGRCGWALGRPGCNETAAGWAGPPLLQLLLAAATTVVAVWHLPVLLPLPHCPFSLLARLARTGG